MHLTLTVLALASLAFCGVPVMREAVLALARDRRITAALLISTAMIACIAIGQLFAAGEIACFDKAGTLQDGASLRVGAVSGALVHNLGSVLVVLNAALLYDRKFRN